ncbi:MAG TPA: PEP-CTERM sorting domain-containing protein, partial [Methylomirabilota bacterium]|nr:PEP-CTERM sorting domain-containing protein [Methylomirabilota bacterium]
MPAITVPAHQSWSLYGGGPVVNGWQFSLQSDIQLTRLGLYDNPAITDGGFLGDGLLEPHPIGVWDISNPYYSFLVVTAVISFGTSAAYDGGFRYVDIDPVLLSASGRYVIGALYEASEVLLGDWNVGEINNPSLQITVNPLIQYEVRRVVPSLPGSLIFPENIDPSFVGDFGPNFTFTVVPEPSTVALFLSGISLLLAS